MPTNKMKSYRVFRIEDKITWQVQELWDDGIVRGPYGSKEIAIKAEEKIAAENGFIKDLVLQEVVGEEMAPAQAFGKNPDGTWRCLQGCSINIAEKEVVFSEGMTFTEGTPYMGIDIAKWLDENVKTAS